MSDLIIRPAQASDLPIILSLIDGGAAAPSQLTPSDPSDPEYLRAFKSIETDANNTLVVGEIDGEVVCTTQLTFIPGISRKGAWRAMCESVHVRADQRGKGTGGKLMRWAIAQSRERGCNIIQLTSDKRRSNAHRFYENLGFTRSHEGFKLFL